MLDLATLHEAIAAAVPDRECLVWGDHRVTWREMAERTRRLANVLHGHGLGLREDGGRAEPWESPHEHLALYLHNGPEYLEGLVGAHKARVAPFNVNYRYVDDELAHLFRDARPAAVIYHARFAPVIGRVVAQLERRPLLLQVADASGEDLLPGALDYEEALAKASAEPLRDVRPEAGDLHILYTGGTTGMPKGVLWRIGDLMTGPLGMRRRDGAPLTDLGEALEKAVRSDHRVLVGPPLMHGAGTWSALGGWCGGACVVFPGRVDGLDAADLMATAERERITRMPLVGDAFARPIVEALEARPHDLGSMRTFVNSAAAISPDVKRRLLELLPHARIVDILGSSESGFQVARNGSSARSFMPTPGTAVLSADRSRRLAPGEDEMGWLAKGGDAIPLGYLGDPAKTAATFLTLDGERLVVAGDRARLLADGTVEVHGREATTINTGGEKVFAEEVENVLRGLPGVADALVVGRPSERWGTKIVAVVRPVPDGAAPGDEELREGCAAHLARYKIPKAFVRTDLGLRLPNGKADYATARTLLN
ncbi:AMP-binding protein [Actinomadura livida]|uniref:Acyl-CoA synthetase n=1 Tax=Actinomadura livida TaxID=79909 RepID=A0A7W7I9G6_9ACTN|nr:MULTISPECIES: AMP-binding protein [Actinomadura]MBB4772904.1 acyl-CoA synthetase (AMP-forming)/AMP-acid ligase II [Actinomadura catellatispora]GGU13561.1 acyl-CoA synthetase [Actinomadura livida]